MTEQLQATVAALTTLLLWPVVVALLLAVGHTLFLVGELAVEALRRRGRPAHLVDPAAPPPVMLRRRGVSAFGLERAADPGASPWLLLDRTEAALAGRADRARAWARLAPALGLAGTLIPLGPGLTALAQGDLRALSDALVLAFGTTVLGLFAGGLAWVVATTQERWYRLDLAELRHALERVAPSEEAA